jgi:hypothetical protein
MAAVKLRSYLKELNGRYGDYIFYNIKGRQYMRSYSIPRNPRTEAQQENRSVFAEAVKLWQTLSAEEKHIYNRLASRKALTGYNLFISMHMKGITLQQKTADNKGYIKLDHQYVNRSKAGNSVIIPYLIHGYMVNQRKPQAVYRGPAFPLKNAA